MTLDEKFDAVRIDHAGSDATHEHKVISSDDTYVVCREETEKYVRELLKDTKNQLGLSALSNNNPAQILQRTATVTNDTQNFNVKIPFEGSPVTNQGSSGRCWLFASTNVFRIAIQKKYDIENFELSQAYLFFWDKVEKANYYLETHIQNHSEPIDGRLISSLNASPVGDGGQWDMVVNLVTKYGIVPQELYRDSWNAQHSRELDTLLETKLRQDALVLRHMKQTKLPSSKVDEVKDHFMQQVVRILTLTLGPPPQAEKKFTWEYSDRAGKLKSINMSPLEFAASTRVDKFFSLVNDPRNEYHSLLLVDNLNNCWDGRPIMYVNLDMHDLRKAAVRMLKKGLPIFFGCDVGKFSDSRKGIMDTELIDYELGFNVKLGMTKAQRLLTGSSQMTHAMVLTAVHIVDDKPVRWRVQNSWGNVAGSDGYFVMSDAWMDEFVYQIVVDPSVVDDEVRDVLKQEPKHLPLWDPMGALA